MEVYFLGAYSDDAHRGMIASSFTARKKVLSVMLEKVNSKVVIMFYF